MEETRRCGRCNRTKPLTEFAIDRRIRKGTGKPGWLKHCAECEKKISNKRARDNYDPRAKRDRYLRRKYGISIEQFEQMIEEQGGGCAICGEVPTKGAGRAYQAAGESKILSMSGKFSVDHDHNHCPMGKGCPECIRGVLCPGCNVALGSLNTILRLESAIEYLRKNER